VSARERILATASDLFSREGITVPSASTTVVERSGGRESLYLVF